MSERENNIILKAITVNSLQFKHESATLSLKRGGGWGGERNENGGKGGEKNSTLRRIAMSDKRLISAPGRILQTRLGA